MARGGSRSNICTWGIVKLGLWTTPHTLAGGCATVACVCDTCTPLGYGHNFTLCKGAWRWLHGDDLRRSGCNHWFAHWCRAAHVHTVYFALWCCSNGNGFANLRLYCNWRSGLWCIQSDLGRCLCLWGSGCNSTWIRWGLATDLFTSPRDPWNPRYVTTHAGAYIDAATAINILRAFIRTCWKFRWLIGIAQVLRTCYCNSACRNECSQSYNSGNLHLSPH